LLCAGSAQLSPKNLTFVWKGRYNSDFQSLPG
jgi:hypothetical protein